MVFQNFFLTHSRPIGVNALRKNSGRPSLNFASKLLLYPQKRRPPFWTAIISEPQASARMAGVEALKRLFRTFLSLKGTCHRSEVNFYSDSDGDCHVTLRVTTPGTGFQSPCRGGAQPRGQERQSSGTRNPPPPPAAAAPAPAGGGAASSTHPTLPTKCFVY